jgi:hypothetical protein
VNFLLEKCIFKPLDETLIKQCSNFNCEHNDLNEFFNNEAIFYSNQLLGKSYCFVLQEDPSFIVCAFTVSNDSINVNIIPGSRKQKVNKDIPRTKQMKRYPAVLIGRLGVNKDFKGKHIGSELMGFIKSWFIDPYNKTGCRYIVVDSYNEDGPLKYYISNNFEYLFSTEEQEAKSSGMQEKDHLLTRLMYFDLIHLKSMK